MSVVSDFNHRVTNVNIKFDFNDSTKRFRFSVTKLRIQNILNDVFSSLLLNKKLV